MTATRRLAAILAADVVGFSRLMEADEAGTLARLKGLRRDVMDPCFAGHHGRIVKLMGDGVLVEFASVVDAVQCAVALQEAMRAAEPGLPEGRRIAIRIGVNLGDVIVDGDDIYGDGVNVAARLQALADPGSVAVSGTVREHVAGKLAVTLEDLGEHAVKNIERPVRVYRAAASDARTAVAATGGREPVRSEKVSIAVLPFDNMSGDPDQLYFSDGITEDIITELSKFRELLVIARNSAFHFRGKANDITEVARKLGVQFVVEGSVRKAGNRIRVTVQLIEAAFAAHVWAERYDRDLTDIFEIQDEITRTAVTHIASNAQTTIAGRTKLRPTESLSAYDCYLQARSYFRSDVTALQAAPLLRNAIDLDPNFADAHALMSNLETIRYFHDGQTQHLGDALVSAQRALVLDPAGPRANHATGLALTHMGRLDEAARYLRRAISLNPNETYFRGDLALLMDYMGDTEGAARELEEGIRRDPYVYEWLWTVRGILETRVGKYMDALESFRHEANQPPWSHLYQAICHGGLGQMADARECLGRFREAAPGTAPLGYLAGLPYADASTKQRFAEIIRRVEALDLQ